MAETVRYVRKRIPKRSSRKGGSTREPRSCMGCGCGTSVAPWLMTAFGIWGGLSERERRRLKRGII